MDDFLTKLYNEELEKTAGAGQRAVFKALPVSDLEAFLGIEKVAVGGPTEPDVSPAFKKAFQAREMKGKEAQREVIKDYSKSETQVERNIAPLKAGVTVPDRNISPESPQVSAPSKSLPDRDYVGQGETKQAALEWADQMGRSLAHMKEAAAAPETWLQQIMKHVKAGNAKRALTKGSCAMGKAACAMRSIKLAHQFPVEMMPALIETTASEMRKASRR